MALNEAKLPLILYRKVKTIEHVIVRTSCHISIPCLISFSASAIPTLFSFKFNVFCILVIRVHSYQEILSILLYIKCSLNIDQEHVCNEIACRPRIIIMHVHSP